MIPLPAVTVKVIDSVTQAESESQTLIVKVVTPVAAVPEKRPVELFSVAHPGMLQVAGQDQV